MVKSWESKESTGMEKDFTLLAYRLKALSEILTYAPEIVIRTGDNEFFNSMNDLVAQELLTASEVLLEEDSYEEKRQPVHPRKVTDYP